MNLIRSHVKSLTTGFLTLSFWAMSFIFLKSSLFAIPSLLLTFLRTTLTAFPLIFFVRPPKIPLKILISYSLFVSVFQFFGLVFGIRCDLSPAFVSLLVQTQVFFTYLLSSIFLRSSLSFKQVWGILLSFFGIAIIPLFDRNAFHLLGITAVLSSALCWSYGNILLKRFRSIRPLSLVVWGNFIASFPILCISLLFEGESVLTETFSNLQLSEISGILYSSYVSNLFCSFSWGKLVQRHSLHYTAPLMMCVPVLSQVFAFLILKERPDLLKIVSSFLIFSGLFIHFLQRESKSTLHPFIDQEES